MTEVIESMCIVGTVVVHKCFKICKAACSGVADEFDGSVMQVI